MGALTGVGAAGAAPHPEMLPLAAFPAVCRCECFSLTHLRRKAGRRQLVLTEVTVHGPPPRRPPWEAGEGARWCSEGRPQPHPGLREGPAGRSRPQTPRWVPCTWVPARGRPGAAGHGQDGCGTGAEAPRVLGGCGSTAGPGGGRDRAERGRQQRWQQAPMLCAGCPGRRCVSWDPATSTVAASRWAGRAAGRPGTGPGCREGRSAGRGRQRAAEPPERR